MDKLSILIIDDELPVLKAIKAVLVREDMQVTCAQSSDEALGFLKEQNYDLILLDIMMPGKDGFSLLKEVRSIGIFTPVILLSGREEDAAQVEGLGLGADDYMTKPFSKTVLVSKIRAIVRRSSQYAAPHPAAMPGTLKKGAFEVLLSSQTVYKNGREIALSSKEFSLLCLFVENSGRVLSKQEIFSSVWKSETPDNNTILVYIKRLRNKIEEDPANPVHLQTVWGKGYQFYP